MVAIALIVLALAGGSVATYFVMDSARREAKSRLRKIVQDQIDLDDDRVRFNEKARELEARSMQLAKSIASHEQRVSEVAKREADFERRVIAYADLAAENRILRVELKNATTHTAFLEHLQRTNQTGASAVATQRDRLGRMYFDEVVTAARKALSPTTYATVKQRIRNAAERIRSEGFNLTTAAEEQALSELHILFEKAVQAAVEREEQARLKEQMREEQKRRKEEEEATEQAEMERAAVEAALQKALAEKALAEQRALAEQKALAEKALAETTGKHAEEIQRQMAEMERMRVRYVEEANRQMVEVEQLRNRLTEVEEKQRAISEAQKTKKGHVYIISNIGSFGRDVFKIGMTRRLDPMDRVFELGDASVPFPFDVHAMISCNDAPSLENALHSAFDTKRVNRVNPRKEFFRVTIEEIVAAVRQNHGEVEYVADAEALEFNSSLNATDEVVEEIEKAYEKAEAALPPLETKEDD